MSQEHSTKYRSRNGNHRKSIFIAVVLALILASTVAAAIFGAGVMLGIELAS